MTSFRTELLSSPHIQIYPFYSFSSISWTCLCSSSNCLTIFACSVDSLFTSVCVSEMGACASVRRSSKAARDNIALATTKSMSPTTRFSTESRSLVKTIPVIEAKIISSSGFRTSNIEIIDLISDNFVPLPSRYLRCSGDPVPIPAFD